jgi:hypothetical protein
MDYLLEPPLTRAPLSPNIFLSTLLSNTVSLCSSLYMRDQVSHPYKTGKIIVQYIFIFIFFDKET